MTKFGVVPKKEWIVMYSTTKTPSIPSGGSETITITPADGEIRELVGLFLNVSPPAGASSGSHKFDIDVNGTMLMLGESSYATKLTFRRYFWESADVRKEPSTEVGTILAFKGTIFDKVEDLTVYYYNDTDVSQANARTYRIYQRARRIA